MELKVKRWMLKENNREEEAFVIKKAKVLRGPPMWRGGSEDRISKLFLFKNRFWEKNLTKKDPTNNKMTFFHSLTMLSALKLYSANGR
jgi:hypothetical protein